MKTFHNSAMSYRDIIGWQKSMDFVEAIYRYSRNLPKEENFGLVQQLRRAAVAIPSNIAEGYGRNSRLDYARYVDIALGSTREAQTQLEICQRLGYGYTEDLQGSAEEIAKILFSLAKSLRSGT